MTIPPQSWRPHEIEAYRAWQSGDPNRLLKACDRVITSHARGFERRSRRGSDELHPKKEAELREAGLYEAKVVADFDELYQVGCETVLKVRDRYDPKKASFQAFAYKRVWGAMMDTLDAKQKHLEEEGRELQDQSLGALLDAALRQDGRAFFDRLYALWRETSPDEWRGIIENANFELVRFFWGFLHRSANKVACEIGEDKRQAMLKVTTTWYWQLVFARQEESGASFRDISGPQHVETIERGRKARGILPSKVDDRPLARMFGRDGKTVARWRNDIKRVGAPPLMREDGSFTIRSTEDWDVWLDYWLRIAEPQEWSRLQKRLEQEAE